MQPGAQNNNPFTNPNAPGAGSVAPKIYDLEGCLVAMQPTAFTAAGTADNLTGFEGSPPRDRVTANVILLETSNGQPVTFGGDKTKGTPDTHYAPAPARFTGVWLNSQNIVAALAPGGQPQVGALILGRVRRSEVGRRPWNLVAVDGTPDMAKAIDIYNRITMGQLQYSEPVPMGGAPAPANSVSYAAPTTQATPAPNGFAPPPVAPAPTLDPYQQWLAQQQAQAAPVAPPAPVLPMPPGWQPAQWDTLNDGQKTEVLRSMGIPVPA